MKTTTLLFFLLSITLVASSQVTYPKGCYFNFEDLVNKTPVTTYHPAIEKRSKTDIAMNGGNDYKLDSPDNTIKRKVLKKEIFAYSSGDTLYINCSKYRLQNWYANVISDGKYFVFMAGIPMDPAMQSKKLKEDIQMSMQFGAVAGAFAGAELAKLRFLYIVDKETNEVKMVDPEVMNNVLKDYPDLYTKYNTETKKDDREVQIEFLKQVNGLGL